MKGVIWLMLVAVLLSPMTGLGAGFTDDFDSYETGALSTVSGGLWRPYANSAPDAQVVTGGASNPNAMLFDNTYGDVIRFSDEDLLAGGSATLSFDFYVTSGNDNMGAGVMLAAGSPSDSTINGFVAGSEVAYLVIGYGQTTPGVTVHLYGANFWEFPLLTTVSPDAWHQLSLTALATGSFDVYVDGSLVGDDQAFAPLTDPQGLNAVEFGTTFIPGAGEAYGVYKFDNVSLTGAEVPMVPVPGAMLMVSLGSGAVALCRRKRIL